MGHFVYICIVLALLKAHAYFCCKDKVFFFQFMEKIKKINLDYPFKFSMTKKCWKPSFFKGIFLFDDKGNACFGFSNITK